MKKRFLPVLVRVIVLLTCWFYVGSVFGQRDATATDTFPINNKNDLLNFMYCLNKSGNEDGGKFYYYNGFYTSNSDLETHDYSYISTVAIKFNDLLYANFIYYTSLIINMI